MPTQHSRAVQSSKFVKSVSAAVSIFALLAGSAAPAYADVTNTATVSGTAPDSSSVTSDSNTVAIDPIDATSSLTISKAASFETVGDDVDADGKGDVGDKVTYTYTVTNTGTTSLGSVDIVDTHDGDGTTPAPLFSSWTTQNGSTGTSGDPSVTMNPGAVAVFKSTYIITANDILNAGFTGVGATIDNDIDNSAVATGDYNNGLSTVAVPSSAALASIALDIVATMSVAKTAYTVDYPVIAGGSAAAVTPVASERPAGTVVYYVYEVTNTGNVPVTNVTLNDVHNGLPSGVFTQPQFHTITNTSTLSSNPESDGTVEVLYPGDVAIFRTSYTITQTDVDQNQ